MTEKKNEATVVPDRLPDGFPSVDPHVNEKSYRYTITLRNSNYYAVTSDAKSAKELFSRFCIVPGSEEAKKSLLDFTAVESPSGVTMYVHFPEATIGIGPDKDTMLEAVAAGWPPEDEEDYLDEEEEDDEEDDLPRRKKPKKPW